MQSREVLPTKRHTVEVLAGKQPTQQSSLLSLCIGMWEKGSDVIVM